MNMLLGLLRVCLKLASLLALFIGVMRLFFVDVLVVPHNGMAPTMTYGERVLVWRRAQVDMADVVVCEHPANPELRVLARAVAFAGHTVGSDGSNNLFVDSDRASIEWQGNMRFFDVTREKLFSMRLGSMDYMRHDRHEFMVEVGTALWLPSYHVEQGVYLLGDNRSDTIDDSREFGEVDPAKCHGQVFMRLTPAPPYEDAEDDIRHSYLQWLL